MSNLLDDLVKNCVKTDICIDGKWYIAKPLSKSLTQKDIWLRIQDAWRVITGRSFAVHYMKDELTFK